MTFQIFFLNGNFCSFYSHNIFFKWLTKNKLTFMQMTWGRVGGKPLYEEYQINIGNTNNRVTCHMNYVLLTSNSYEMSLYTSVILYICEMHCPANVIMMVADVLTPNKHQCITYHHRDCSSISGFTSSHQHNIHIPLRPLNKQYLREVSSSATCCWQWARLLTRITLYYQSMLSIYDSHS